MLVDALALLLGERASSDVVRPGAQKTVIEGAFEFTSAALSRLLPPFAALGVEVEEGRLVLKREISGEGRSRAWVNGSPTTVGVLAQLGALLVDLHGQHETQSLLRIDAQRDMLDAYADAAVERTAVRDADARPRGLERREEELAGRREDVRRKSDYLRHVVEEIERAAPQNGEVEALEVEAKRLAHADELGRLSRELGQALDTAGLSRAAKLVGGLTRLDHSVAQWQELLDGAFAHVEELVQAVRGYAAAIESDPNRLGAVEQRRDVLFRLVQKYGPGLPDVLATRDRATHELELLDTADLDLQQIAGQRETAAADFARACSALTAKRTKGTTRLAKAVNELLPALGMPGGRFEANLSPLPSPRGDGSEAVTFTVQLNLGLEARPLAKVASGGELSRLMLALKVVLARHDAVPTLVFDEVDQGIGGEAGARGGEGLPAGGKGAGGGRGRAGGLGTAPPPASAAPPPPPPGGGGGRGGVGAAGRRGGGGGGAGARERARGGGVGGGVAAWGPFPERPAGRERRGEGVRRRDRGGSVPPRRQFRLRRRVVGEEDRVGGDPPPHPRSQ